MAIGEYVLDVKAARHLLNGPVMKSQQDVFAEVGVCLYGIFH